MSDSNPALISGIIGGIALVATAVSIGYSIHTNAEEAKAETLRVEEAAKKKAEEAAKKKAEEAAKKKANNATAEALRVEEAAKKKEEEAAKKKANNATAEALRVEEEKKKAEKAEALRVEEEKKKAEKAKTLRVIEEIIKKKAEALRIAKNKENNDVEIKKTQEIINGIHYHPIMDENKLSIIQENKTAKVLHQEEQNAEKKEAVKKKAEEAAKKKAEEAAEALRQIQKGNNNLGAQYNLTKLFRILAEPNKNVNNQLSPPYTGPYQCTKCESTFNNLTNYVRHLIKESENNHTHNQQLNKLGNAKPGAKPPLFHPTQHHLTKRGKNPFIQNEQMLLNGIPIGGIPIGGIPIGGIPIGGIRKHKRTHKKHHRLHNRSYKR